MTPERPDRPASSGDGKPTYEAPRVVAYDQEELLRRIGPAVACARWNPGLSAGARPHDARGLYLLSREDEYWLRQLEEEEEEDRQRR